MWFINSNIYEISKRVALFSCRLIMVCDLFLGTETDSAFYKRQDIDLSLVQFKSALMFLESAINILKIARDFKEKKLIFRHANIQKLNTKFLSILRSCFIVKTFVMILF